MAKKKKSGNTGNNPNAGGQKTQAKSGNKTKGDSADKMTAKAGPDKNEAAKTSAFARNKTKGVGDKGANRRRAAGETKRDRDGYLVSMSHAPRIDEGLYGFQLIPAAIFAAVIILLVRQYQYVRDMTQYYWMSETDPNKSILEFFTHDKGILLVVTLVLAGLILLYRVVTQSFFVKRTVLYIPLLVYLAFVFLSFAFSNSKEIAWEGANDRFEGTMVIFCYCAMLFYMINTVNSERNIKWVVYPVAGSTVLLSILGISQAVGHDFFQTTIGQKLIVPNKVLANGSNAWDMIEKSMTVSGSPWLKFTFEHNEVYQTVYNINYVAFYLTLLVPLFAMIFIREAQPLKKALWGVLFALAFFNLLGAASSGGIMGLFVLFIVALVLLNKRLLKWWKSTALLILIGVAILSVAFVTADKLGGYSWITEVRGTVSSVFNVQRPAAAGGEAETKHKIDYFDTRDGKVTFSVDGNKATFEVISGSGIRVTDPSGQEIAGIQDEASGAIRFSDERFNFISFTPQKDEEENTYMVFAMDGDAKSWPFKMEGENKDRLIYRNDVGKTVDLYPVPSFGFKDNLSFGNGRGYIWSRSLPLIKDTLFIGHGADTYFLHFPHNDYIGKYNTGWNINAIVDKPHNMYIGMAVNTGVISLLAFLILMGIYLVQSFKLYWREEYDSFAAFVGAGIFLGVVGFLVSAVVNDSSVSVMPIFYGLFGTGIAVNILIGKRRKDRENVS